MIILNTTIKLEELLDRKPLSVQYVDKNGFLQYLNKTASKRPANCKREVGVNIQDCHAKPESHEMIERIFKDFRQGRKEPHTTSLQQPGKQSWCQSLMLRITSLVSSYSHPVGLPEPDRTF